MPLNMTLRQLTVAVKIIAAKYFHDNIEKFRGPAGLDGKPGRDGKDGKGIKGDRGERGLPGRDGADGKPGPAGRDGKDGKDGAAAKGGLRWAGRYLENHEYHKGDVVYWREALWVAKKDIVFVPPAEGTSWDLFLRWGSTIVQTRGAINQPVVSSSGGTATVWGEHRDTVTTGETLSLTDGNEAIFNSNLIVTDTGLVRCTDSGRVSIL